MNFKEELAEKTKRAERIVESFLPEETGFQKTVLAAMRYSVRAGGKRLRPILLGEAYRMFGGEKRTAEPFMAALEMIHTYSLVHDDLPAMDNDEYRRGKKTTHVVYGEAMAILAGDGLLNYAFETALKAFVIEPDNDRIPAALAVLAKKAGIHGMIGGQTADIEAENRGESVTQEQLLFIHENKTAALVEAAFMTGAMLAGADETAVARLERAGHNLGVAFQIQDDILDVKGSFQELGKSVGSDAKNNKMTYVTFKGLEQAERDQRAMSQEAVAILASFGQRNPFLEELVKQLTTREK